MNSSLLIKLMCSETTGHVIWKTFTRCPLRVEILLLRFLSRRALGLIQSRIKYTGYGFHLVTCTTYWLWDPLCHTIYRLWVPSSHLYDVPAMGPTQLPRQHTVVGAYSVAYMNVPAMEPTQSPTKCTGYGAHPVTYKRSGCGACPVTCTNVPTMGPTQSPTRCTSYGTHAVSS
jgi:hypothetical protein